MMKVGDTVTITDPFCEMTGTSGNIIAVSSDPNDSMPYMVQFFSNLREWPFAEYEMSAWKDIDEEY